MPSLPVDRLLEALTGDGPAPRKNGSGWMAVCPAHDDRRPSLSVTEAADGKALFHCQAGCSQDAVTDALKARGLDMSDLFSDEARPRQSARRVVATYKYTDEAGALLYEVLRYEPKGFSQRPANGKTGPGSMDGVRRVLYKLTAVIEAAAAGRTVYVVEGERDAESAEKAGVVATCNPMGAGKWRAEYADVLRGARVVVVADRDEDETGLRHARDVEASLQGVAASVDIVEAAPGCKDLSDHLKAGFTLEDLRPVAPPTPPADCVETRNGRSSESVSLSSIKRERVEFLVPGIPRGMLTLLVGDPGLGKSLRSVELAAQVSRSGRGVILLTNEDHLAAVVRPRLQAAGADLALVYTVRMRGVEGDEDGLWLPDDAEHLATAIREREADLFVVDPFASFLPKNVDSFKDQSVRTALRPLKEIAEETGAAGLLLAHLNKGLAGNALHRVGGSIGFPAAVRSAWLMARDPDDPDGEAGYRRVCAHIKCNVGAYEQSEVWVVRSTLLPAHDGEPEVSTARIERHGVSPHSGSSLLASATDEERSAIGEAKSFILDELADGPAKHRDLVANAKDAGISERTLKRAKLALKVRSEKGGFGGSGEWLWSLPAKGANLESAQEISPLGTLTTNPHGYGENQRPDTTSEPLRGPISTMAPLGDPGASSNGATIGPDTPVGHADAQRLVDQMTPLLQRADFPAAQLYPGVSVAAGRDSWRLFCKAALSRARRGDVSAVTDLRAAISAVGALGETAA